MCRRGQTHSQELIVVVANFLTYSLDKFELLCRFSSVECCLFVAVFVVVVVGDLGVTEKRASSMKC